jgi:hypothetical protein
MADWTPTDRRIGTWSAAAVVLFGVIYVGTGATWFATSTDARARRLLQPTDPFLAIMEALILLCAPALVALFAAIHAYAPRDRKTCSLVAFGCAVLLAALTGIVHFVLLSVGRQMSAGTLPAAIAVSPDSSLSPLLAVDLLGWDFFLGFGLLFAAPVFTGGGLSAAVRLGMIVSGVLCLGGVAGPMTGDMRFQIPAILGYAIGLPVVCFFLALLFNRADVFTGA